MAGGSSPNKLCVAFAFTSPTTATLRYDPLGRLYETGGGAAGITRFLFDGDELVAEYNSSGAMLRRYVHGSGNDDPMAWYEGTSVDTNVAKLIKTNHQGSGIALTDDWGSAAETFWASGEVPIRKVRIRSSRLGRISYPVNTQSYRNTKRVSCRDLRQ